MKLLSGIAVLAVITAGAAVPSYATTISTSGGSVTGGTIGAAASLGSFATVATTGSTGYIFGGTSGTTDTGTYDESVGNWSGDTSGLTYIITVKATTGDVENINLGSFSAASTLFIFQTANGGTISATNFNFDANTGGVEFNFPPNDVVGGDQSYTLIVGTDDPTYTAGFVGLIDSGSSPTLAGFQPGVAAATPEPSTLSLLGTGLLAVGAGLRRRMLRK